MELDVYLQSLGKCGCYHTILFLSFGLIYLRGSWHIFAPVFIAADPGHTCVVKPNITDEIVFHNLEKFHVNYSVTDSIKSKSCSINYLYFSNETSDNGSISSYSNESITSECENGWRYGDQFKSTIVTDWDLVCDDDYKVELSTTIYMLGTGCGALGLTYFSDRFGRKRLLIVCLLLQGVLGLGVAFVTSFLLFTLLRFFIGVLNMGIGLTTFIMVTETYQASIRTIPSIGIQIFWAFGIMFLALFGYLVRDWRHLQILISLPNFLIVIYIFFIPESLPWLIINQKYTEANRVIERARKLNKKTGQEKSFNDSHFTENDNMITNNEEVTCNDSIKNSMIKLFCMKEIRLYTLVIIYLYIVNSLIYMGISFSMPVLHGDIFLNLFLSGLVEIPAHVICMFVVSRVGRKIPLMAFLFLCAMSTIAGAVCPDVSENGSSLIVLQITLFMVSKFAITGSYSTIYLYSAEIFPTVVRNFAMGIASFFENLGAVGAPFIIYVAKKFPIIHVILFSSFTIVGGFLVMVLPETNKQPLPQTITDTKAFRPTINRNGDLITEL